MFENGLNLCLDPSHLYVTLKYVCMRGMWVTAVPELSKHCKPNSVLAGFASVTIWLNWNAQLDWKLQLYHIN